MRNEGERLASSDGPPTEQFGAYLVFERLGKGGMATVHRAKKRGIAGFERTVALKRMLPHLCEDAEFITSFVHEAKLASLLAHPNIAQIFDFGRIDDVYYIAMELVAGFDLHKLLRYCHQQDVFPPLNVVLSLLCELCDALEFAHTFADEHGQPYGIVHRDVSPSNLIVANTGHLKVIDFGIAKALTLPAHTEERRIKGKLGYMAPEAIEGRPVGPPSDVFSLGVVAHELLTVERLFHAATDHEMLSRVRHREIPLPSRINDRVPASLDRVVMAALERDDRRRLQSAGEFRRALAAVAVEVGIQMSSTDVAEWWAGGGALQEQGASRESRASFSDAAMPRVVEFSGSDQRARLAGSSVESLRGSSLGGLDAQRPAVSAPKMASAPPSVRSRAPGRLVLAGLCTIVVVAVAVAVAVAAYLFLVRPPSAVAPAAPKPPAEPARTGLVKFVVQPPDSIVEVGGKEVTRQSPFELAIEPGAYSIAAHRVGFKRWTSQVTLHEGETQTIDVALEPAPARAFVTITSEPAGAVVKLDGQKLDQVTPAEFAVGPGAHRLVVVGAAGSWAQEFTAVIDGTHSFHAVLPAKPTPLTGVARTAPPPPERTQRRTSPSAGRAPVAHEPVVQLEERSSEPVPEAAAAKPLIRAEPPPTVAPPTTPPAPALPTAPLRVRSATPPVVPVSAVKKLSGEMPAIQHGGQASVLSKICIGLDGRVTSVRVIRASPGIAAEVERSLLRWRYQPYIDDAGQPTPACFAVSLRFQPDGR